MSDHDSDTGAVLDTLRDALDDVDMRTSVEQIVATGRARKRRRFAYAAAGLTAGAAAVTGLVLSSTPAAPTAVHIQTVAYTVDTQSDGTIRVSWDKQRYFDDPAGLAAALRKAGFPVVIKTGEFCRGPHDSAALTPSGQGPGVDKVMKGEEAGDGRTNLVFTPSAMPPKTELFIGYLSPAQLATSGGLGSVERLVPTNTELICTTQAPPPHNTGPNDPNPGPTKSTDPGAKRSTDPGPKK